MTTKPKRRILLAFVLATGYASCAIANNVAGLAPYQRPAQAPTITTPAPIDKTMALHGVSEPTPPSLGFLDNQGGWYTPFNHPGMLAPYDLRGWHSNPPSGKQEQ